MVGLCLLAGNVLKEIVEPLGAVIHAEKFELGDPTISMVELWGAEYQESDALLVRPEDRDLLARICEREKVCDDIVACIVVLAYLATGFYVYRLQR